jgi:hypothetical protein
LEGPDFELFFEGAMALLYRLTGVDPDTLWKESAGPSIEAELYDESPALSSPSEDAGEDGGGGPLATPQTRPAAAVTQSPPARASDHLAGGDGGGSGLVSPDSRPAAADPVPVMRHENIVGSIEADERAALATAEPMSTAALKQEAIKKVIDLALELHAQTDPALTPEQITTTMAECRRQWIEKMPGHPQFVKTTFETAAKVMRGELPRPAAQKYLFSLKDG